MGSEDFIDNLFRIVQTKSRLKNDKVTGEKNASQTHYIIAKNDGTMPENLYTPKRSMKEIEKEEIN